MVATRNIGKRASSGSSTATTVATKKTKRSSPTVTLPANTKIPFSVDELTSKKEALNKVAAPKPAPNLKLVTPVVKTAIVISVGSLKKAFSSPLKNQKRLTSPVRKRPSSG
ncbi:hypothetical protein HK100_008763 [Physocladia obscura]|uniref:Uncharacterized protein n=1 Tax=Physocladia obscura TaxID=109957 RepID=A0AAD5XJL1_9FUNG|nr:hypothetical protein HK100_008763 [Physocladia obscura]